MKMAGCCTLCDKEVFEVAVRFPAEDPRAGQPKVITAPFENARRVTYQLDNGSLMDLTFCDECDTSDFAKIIDVCVKATLATSRPGEPVRAYMLERSILGLLYERSWQDVIAKEVADAARLRTVA